MRSRMIRSAGVGLLAISLIVLGVGAVTLEADAGDGTPSWDAELPLAQLQTDLAPDQETMALWRSTAEACMDSAGFGYDASGVSFKSQLVDSNRYGIAETPIPGSDTGRDSGVGTLDPEMRQQFDKALFGESHLEIALSDGSTLYLPVGGCVETADKAALDDRVAYWRGFHETQIASAESLARTEATPSIQALMSEWRACMADAGFVVDSIEDAAGQSVTDPGVIDAHNLCDDQLNYTERWVEEESRIQAALLEERTDLRQLAG